MKNLWQKIRKAFRSDLDVTFEKAAEEIREKAPKAEARLKELGWNILSVDTRIVFYSFKIQKGEHIHRVSIDEALKMS